MNEENKDLLDNEEVVNEEINSEVPAGDEIADADKVTDWETKYNELNDSFLRLNAEFDNYRKRTLKEKADMLKSGSERVLVDVISVVDDFERALENIGQASDVDSLKEGVDLIYSKFTNFLKKHSVKEIETIGQTFDADRHEALTTIPAQSDADQDKIVDCIQKGYTLDDKVIRYPKVIVAK